MAEKVRKTGIVRDDMNYLYFIKAGAVWRVPRKQPGVQKGRPEKVYDAGIEMDTSFIYFLDKDGDISCAKMVRGGAKKKAKKAAPKKKAAKRK